MKVDLYSESDDSRWDNFVKQTAQGTFLHTRRFMGYHGNRFVDHSLLFEDTRGELRAVMPIARSLSDASQAVSHPGITHGGLLHLPRCSPAEVFEMLQIAQERLGALGCRSLIYKTVPAPVQRTCVQADLYALWRTGATVVRRDLWNTVALGVRRHAASGHLRDARRARMTGFRAALMDEERDYVAFHDLLTQTLAQRHGVVPVHACQEMLSIWRLFPKHVQLWGCRASDGELVAGIWLFRLHEDCWHTQYIAASAKGRENFATDFLLEAIVDLALTEGARVLTLGASTANGGKQLNDSLFYFKSRVGAGSAVHDFYRIDFSLGGNRYEHGEG
jgi:hypothetical protein